MHIYTPMVEYLQHRRIQQKTHNRLTGQMNIVEERMVVLLVLAAANSGGGLDPGVVAAIIGAIALVVGAIIAFAGIMYGSRQQKKMMRFQKELDAQEAF